MLYSLGFILILPRCKQLTTGENHPKTQEEKWDCTYLYACPLHLLAWTQSLLSEQLSNWLPFCLPLLLPVQTDSAEPTALPLAVLSRCPSLLPFHQALPFPSGSFLHSAVSVGILKVLVCSLLSHPSVSLARSLAYVFINLLYKLIGFYKWCWE